jgi:enoyl-CoA hydratase/carnithine racemase
MASLTGPLEHPRLSIEPVPGIDLDADSGVRNVLMHGPKGNPLDLDLILALRTGLAKLAEDPACRAVILSSSDKNFCVGAVGKITGAHEWSASDLYTHLPALFAFPKPMVAVLHGAAIGGGLGLAMVADFRVAEVSATLSVNFSQLGYHHGFGLGLTLPRVVGHQVARDLLYTSRRIDGTEAFRLGLCDQVSPDGEGMDAAVERAVALAAAAPLAVGAIKATMIRDLLAGLPAELARDFSEQSRLKATRDFHEGMAAARERRTPRFTGE